MSQEFDSDQVEDNGISLFMEKTHFHRCAAGHSGGSAFIYENSKDNTSAVAITAIMGCIFNVSSAGKDPPLSMRTPVQRLPYVSAS